MSMITDDQSAPVYSAPMQVAIWIFSIMCNGAAEAVKLLASIQLLTIGGTMEFIYIWVFRVLSLLSLILIIAMNWGKGVDSIKNIFKGKQK